MAGCAEARSDFWGAAGRLQFSQGVVRLLQTTKAAPVQLGLSQQARGQEIRTIWGVGAIATP